MAANATVNLDPKDPWAALSTDLGPITYMIDTKGKTTFSKKVKDFNFSVSTDGTTLGGQIAGPDPFSPSFGTENATLPKNPNLPRQGEFDFWYKLQPQVRTWLWQQTLPSTWVSVNNWN